MLEKEQQRSRPRLPDITGVRKQIDRLSSKIDNAEEAILDAPANLRPGLYRKLEQLTESRQCLIAEMQTLSRDSEREGRTIHR